METVIPLLTPYLLLAYKFAVLLAPIWAPIVLVMIAWKLWIRYINQVFISKIEWSLLEVRIPKDVFKSPLAMELVLNAFYQTGGVGTWYHKYWLGNLPLWHSLEIVSIEGRVYFFIRTPKKFETMIKAQIYAQYPQAEINALDTDYAFEVPAVTDGANWSMYGTEFKLTKADPIPIKTYVDYGLDKAVGMLKEEERIDPLTPTIEFMGSLTEGEQFWMQILIRPSNWARYTTKEGKNVKWNEYSRQVIKDITDKYADKDEKGKIKPGFGNVPKSEMNTIAAIERNAAKIGFDAGVRAVYIAPKEKFNGVNISAMLGVFRQFGSNDMNGFAPTNTTAPFDYPWQDITGSRQRLLRKKLLNAYRLRSFFYEPYERTPFVLSSEELATIYHFPGRVIETPSFKRIDSKKAEPPQNLPI